MLVNSQCICTNKTLYCNESQLVADANNASYNFTPSERMWHETTTCTDGECHTLSKPSYPALRLFLF